MFFSWSLTSRDSQDENEMKSIAMIVYQKVREVGSRLFGIYIYKSVLVPVVLIP